MKRGKKYIEAAKLVDRSKQYEVEEAVSLVKKAAPAKTVAKEAAKVVSKPAAKVEAKAADAMEAQGRAMVKKYQKPEIEVVKMENPKSLRATSDNGGMGGGEEWFSDDTPAKAWGESIWE